MQMSTALERLSKNSYSYSYSYSAGCVVRCGTRDRLVKADGFKMTRCSTFRILAAETMENLTASWNCRE